MSVRCVKRSGGRSDMSAAKRVALAGVMTAATMVLSYIETLVPLPVGIPGIKLGLANSGVMSALYLLGPGWACAVSIVRVVLSGLLFGGFSAMLYSLAGAVFALASMISLKTASDRFGMVGVSVAGAVTHIVGQLAVAWLVTRTAMVWTYAPVLFAAACATGVLNGIIAGLVVRSLVRS